MRRALRGGTNRPAYRTLGKAYYRPPFAIGRSLAYEFTVDAVYPIDRGEGFFSLEERYFAGLDATMDQLTWSREWWRGFQIKQKEG